MDHPNRYPNWVRWLRKVFDCLLLVRFNLIILIAGWLLLQVDQGQDALISYAARDDWLIAGFWFFFWVFYWAFSIWFFARTMFRFRFPITQTLRFQANPGDAAGHRGGERAPDDRVFLWMKAYLPRILGTLAFLAVAHALWSAHSVVEADLTGRFLLWFGIALALMIPFFLVVQYRRDIVGRIGTRLEWKQSSDGDTWIRTAFQKTGIEDDPCYDGLGDLVASPWGVFVVIASMVGAITFLFATLNPVAVGTFMSAILLFFLWAGSWLPIGSLITYTGNKYGIPMITLLLVAAIGFSPWNDNHEIHTLGDLPPRPTVDQALDAWRNSPDGGATGQLVLVATAGGGIRAAYWTATVLGELQRKVDGFDDKLFAISGVSGGSVGASVYRAVLAEGISDHEIGSKAQKILSGEFLGPAVAGLLYPDLLQRFLFDVGLPDRGRALEEGWEHAYSEVMGSDRFAESLLALNQPRPWPALLLNATRVETGRRSVASNLKLELAGKQEGFAVLDDQLEDIGRDISLASAAHNSARFPGVSPAGHWRDAEGHIRGRLVDGGYFENFGAEAIIDLLRVIDWESADWRGITPVVIAISSDPALEVPFAQAPEAQAGRFASELLSPVNALLAARTSHGIEALARLEHEADAAGGIFFHLRMCAPERDSGGAGQLNPPLGWSLSRVARDTIEGYLGKKCNGPKLEALVEKLTPVSAG